jgi:outer membrane lipoprotein-sorting protein
MRYVGFGAAAAALLAVATTAGVLWFGGNSAEATYRRAMDKAAKAETVRFTWSQTSGPPGQKGKIVTTDKNGNVREYDSSSESTLTVIAKGSKVRLESDSKPVRLEDYQADTGLMLDHKYKVATRFTPGGKDGDWFGLFNRLAKLKPENVKPAGEEMVGKVKALKYELEKGEKTGVIAGEVWEGAKWTIWIDPKTDLPVRLRYMKDEKLKWEFTDFVWNEPADDALFEQKVPPDYGEEKW